MASKLAALVQKVRQGVVQHVLGAGAVTHDAQRHAQQTAAFMLVDAMQGRALAPGRSERGFNQTWRMAEAGRGVGKSEERSSADRAARRGDGRPAAIDDDVTCALPGSRTAGPAFGGSTTGGWPRFHPMTKMW